MPRAKKVDKAAEEFGVALQELQCVANTGVNILDRRCYLIGEITEEVAGKFLIGFDVLDSREGVIFITLCSEGGSIDHGFAIYDRIKLSNNPVVVEVIGMSHSIAALILQAGDWKRATPESRIMIHQGKMFMSGENVWKAEEMGEHAKELSDSNKRYYSILHQGSKGKMSLKEVEVACRKDTYITPEDALNKGLLDEIIQPTKVIKIQKSTKKPKAK
jgi:ATP-dependent Clp protease protease subunit